MHQVCLNLVDAFGPTQELGLYEGSAGFFQYLADHEGLIQVPPYTYRSMIGQKAGHTAF